MNIIEALQALKDGKRIRCILWQDGEYVFFDTDGRLYKQARQKDWVLSVTSKADVTSDIWELYTEPIKLTAEERKALELVKACGYDLLWYDACYLWAHVRGENEAKVADDDFPPLRALKGLFPRATNPTSIDSLLEGTI